MVEKGTIVAWFEDRGFGFIAADFGGPQIYAARWAFKPPVSVTEGDRVFFKVRKGEKGLRAVEAALASEVN